MHAPLKGTDIRTLCAHRFTLEDNRVALKSPTDERGVSSSCFAIAMPSQRTVTRLVWMFTARGRRIKCLFALGGVLNTLEVNRLSPGFLRASCLGRVAVARRAHRCSPRCTTILSAQYAAVTRKRTVAAYGLYIEDTKVTLSTKSNMEIKYGRIGLRRFWAPARSTIG